MIKRLSHTDDNYLIAINSLHDWYADPIKQTEVLLQKFFNLPSPRHNAKELRKFLIEYRKVRDQMRHVEDFDASALTIRSVLFHKLSYQTYSKISDHIKNHNFSLQEMDSTLQYIIGKLKHSYLIMGGKTNVKVVRTNSHQNSNQGGTLKCPFCSGNHKAVGYNKHKSIQARKDRVIAQRLCFNCLIPGHSSKNCRSKRTCRICHFHHHTSLCNLKQSQSSGDALQPSKSNQSSNASRGSQQQQQQQQHPRTQAQNHQQPVVTQHKSNTHKQQAPSTTTSAHVTNINVSNFPHNVLPTATLNVSYCHAGTITRAFFDTGSQRSFVSPELVRKLNLPVIEQVPVHLSTFGNDTALHCLDLVKLKVQVGRRHIPIKLLVHDSASMGYLNYPGIYNVAQTLEKQGHQLADRNITSDSLTGIELLIGVEYFAQFITKPKRASGISLFVTRGGGVIPFGTIPRWAIHNESSNAYAGNYTHARIICESKPELELSELWDLECVGITQDDLSPTEREIVSIVRSSMEKSDAGYIICLPFKDTVRPSVNYRNAKGQLNSLIQRLSHDANLGKQYDDIMHSYVEKEFIEEIPNDPIAGHYMPHHPVFKKSATTPVRIVFNASSKPTDGTSLNGCLFTGLRPTAKLHDILLIFRQGQYAITADISKAFHRILVNEQDRYYLKFLGFNLETEEQRTFRFRVVMFGATCSPYLLQETLQTHLSENVAGREFRDKFYVDNYLNTYDRECDSFVTNQH